MKVCEPTERCTELLGWSENNLLNFPVFKMLWSYCANSVIIPFLTFGFLGLTFSEFRIYWFITWGIYASPVLFVGRWLLDCFFWLISYILWVYGHKVNISYWTERIKSNGDEKNKQSLGLCWLLCNLYPCAQRRIVKCPKTCRQWYPSECQIIRSTLSGWVKLFSARAKVGYILQMIQFCEINLSV